MAKGRRDKTLEILKALRKKARFVVMPEIAFLLYGVKYDYSRKITLILKRRAYLSHFEEMVKKSKGYSFKSDDFEILLIPPEDFNLFPAEILFTFSVKTNLGFVPLPELLMLLSYGEVEPDLILESFKVFDVSKNLLYQLANETGLESRAKHIVNLLGRFQ